MCVSAVTRRPGPGYVAELSDPRQALAVVESFRPDVIVHSAMYSGHPQTAAGRRQCLRDSVEATHNVLEAALVRDAKVIFIGSSTVYRQSEEPLRETSPIDPATDRGAAKAAAAAVFRSFLRQHGLKGAELRLFSVYGPGEPGTRFIPVLLRAAETGEAIRLKRGPRHDFVHVDDVCRACELAIHATLDPGDVFNIAGGVEYANEEVVAAAEAVTGRRITIAREPHSGHPPDTAHWCADIGKARSVLGWTPSHTLNTGLAATAQWRKEVEEACLA